MLVHPDMQHINPEALLTVTGGAATVTGAKKLDDATNQLLTKLSSDIKDLAKNSTSSSSQMTQMMTMMMMGKMMQR